MLWLEITLYRFPSLTLFVKNAGPTGIGPANIIQHLLLDRACSIELQFAVLPRKEVKATPTSGFFGAALNHGAFFSTF
jgi:hypothetical protein